ncbi:MAG: SpaH/EbpB family LPXTG-anchored major pilin [Oscillospiraceae bacterium]|nr:SpaH/EbpB family LPXTG-anchored major pilin [Oscillospiraceae bacterium]
MKLTKIASLILAIALVFSLGITAFAEELGSITINNVTVDDEGNLAATYEIYEILDLESYDTDESAYSYKVHPNWAAFFATDAAKDYFKIDEQNYATWVGEESAERAAAFAKLALAFAKSNSITPDKSTTNASDYAIGEKDGKKEITFSGLDLGYYLVDSTVGALCGLTTTNPDAFINAKNHMPSISKQVQEDSLLQWDSNNTADIGQIVDYRVTIDVHEGAENFILHDKMDSGLTFKEVTSIQYLDTSANNTIDIPDTLYTVKTDIGTCTFEIHFSKELCDQLESNDKVVIHYSAMLNKNAVINGEGNANYAWLEFGDGHLTEQSKTITKTFAIDLVKTDSQNKLIDGAEFKIYDAPENGNEVSVVLMDDGVTYRRARADETGVSIAVKDGIVRIVGFDNGEYYVEETKTPAGFNQLVGRQKFTISGANLEATINDVGEDKVVSTGSGVHVVNKSGTMLPETGGIGTTMFYVIGGVLVAGSLVFLVTKKRMSNQ